ncbi:hypothetical protein PIB30_048280 [Stylosanthes scabra]|uniref:Replication factor A C-terminal domain-containing protein n=1 Tax=Stylosanthes scabra TaxID=79078 RepID=A0ABU6TIW2_9FABA|nr:hypothetical protein [Stylosanthes scabra]
MHCKKKNTSAFIRYKVEVIVCDDTGGVSLLLWDRKAANLCGSKVSKLKLEMEKDYDGYPPTFDNMLEKHLLFKINVKSTNISANDRVYTVMNISDDSELFDSNQPKGVLDDTSLNENMDVRLKDVQSRAHENEEESQFSANKFSKKGGKRQKRSLVHDENLSLGH